MHLTLNESSIIWPGRLRTKPEGFMIPTHLKVLTIEEKPFVYARKLKDDTEFCKGEEIPCPHFNITDEGKTLSSFLKTIPNYHFRFFQIIQCTVVVDFVWIS